MTDNAVGDNNPVLGEMADPFAPALFAATPSATHAAPQPIPTLGQWGLVLLSLLAAGLGVGGLRRRGLA